MIRLIALKKTKKKCFDQYEINLQSFSVNASVVRVRLRVVGEAVYYIGSHSVAASGSYSNFDDKKEGED